MEINSPIIKPRRATDASAGYDFSAPFDIEIVGGEWTTIPTGIRLSDNENVSISTSNGKITVNDWVMLCVPRSGLGFKYGFRLANTVGVIDKDYRGEILAKVTADKPFTLQQGERFMQGIVIPYGIFDDEIPPTESRKGGFGSTGRV